MSEDKKVPLKDTEWWVGYQSFNAGKFAPKLTFQQQNAIFVLHHKYGISINALSVAYGIAPRTVSVLVNRRAKEYKRVKKEEQRLGGLAGMDKTYVFEEDILRVQKAVHGRSSEDKKPNQIFLGGMIFTISLGELNKYIAFADSHEIEVGRFDTWEDARDECLAYAKASAGFSES